MTNETKILHFVKELVPAICITYHRRVFAAVYSSLSLSYKGPFRKLVLDTVGVGQGGSYARFAKLILLLEYANERSTLLNMLSDNPLALNRLFRLEKYYGTPKSFDKSMNEHAKRVSWQLKRIYRVRNSLVHAGEAPEYLESLLGNSLDYFRSCITNFIRVADRDESLADLDSVIAEIGMDWLLMTKRLAEAGNAAFDGETVESLFRPL